MFKHCSGLFGLFAPHREREQAKTIELMPGFRTVKGSVLKGTSRG
jgi:hypothetical protein